MKRVILLSEVGEFFGLDPADIQSVHLDANKETLQFEVRVAVRDEDGNRVRDRRKSLVWDTLRIAVIGGEVNDDNA